MGLQEKTTRFKEMYCSCVAYFPVLIAGMQAGFPAFVVPQFRKEFGLDADKLSWLASSGYFSLILGSIFSVYIINQYGRKTNLRLILATFTVGWAVVLVSKSFNNLLLGNMLCGTAAGSSTSLATIYVSEISRTRYRGSLLSMVWLFNISGSSMVYSLEYYLVWRKAVLMIIAFTLTGQFLLNTIPESKFWYMMADCKEEAKRSATWFENTPVVRKEVDILYSFIKLGKAFTEDENSNSCSTLLRSIQSLQVKPFTLALVMALLRCGTGKILFTVYPVNMFTDMHTPYNSMLLSVWYGFLNFLCCFANILVFTTIDRFNRKNFFYTFTTLMVAALTVIITIDTLSNGYVVLPRLRLVCMYVYLIVEATGYFCITSVMLIEIIPLMQRAIALPINFLFMNLVLAAYIKFFPAVEHHISFRSLCIFFLVNVVLIAILVHRYFPETRGNVYFGSNLGTLNASMMEEGFHSDQLDKMMKEDWFRNEEVQAFFTANEAFSVDNLNTDMIKAVNKQWMEKAREMMKMNDGMVETERWPHMYNMHEKSPVHPPPFDLQQMQKEGQRVLEGMMTKFNPWMGKTSFSSSKVGANQERVFKGFNESQKWFQKMMPPELTVGMGRPATDREKRRERAAKNKPRRPGTDEKIV